MASSSPFDNFGTLKVVDIKKLLDELDQSMSNFTRTFPCAPPSGPFTVPTGLNPRGPVTFTAHFEPLDQWVKFEEYDVPNQPTKKIVASMDITHRQLAVAQGDVIRDAVKRVTAHLEVEVARLIQTSDLAAMAQLILKEELRKAIAGRIDEFVEEMLEDA